ncbi:hypothetical protein N0V93_003070 [Gnomoniopsis smithogilvyi]|uniref:DUF3835 domain-containing protein n=1 Tax=Gnomoniopsis smithogilvyi TaxID=1191159 RepID=A0A9W8YVZ2_9PEZI|nr:hypothetical protein N0V93_003070 [Gnomoniopsis smithogilvyi]
MAAQVKDHFIDLERHRRQLEENVARLQTALQHWRLCDAEYEELKEAVESEPEILGPKQLQQIRAGFKGEVLTDSEVDQLFEKPHKTIINLLDRRIDYVTKNVETLEKQLQAAEQKLATATVVMDPDVRDEDGLPFTDIIEELDENDNVVSSHLQRPGDMQPQMMEALAKAGIKEKDVLEREKADDAAAEGAEGREEIAEDSKKDFKESIPTEIVEEEPPPKALIQEEEPAKSETKPSTQPKKPTAKRAVSFADDTKPGDDANPDDSDSIPPVSRNAQIMVDLMEQARLQAIPSPNPLIPEDESPEDAEMRREMLRYGMTDIAPIVAELEIDEEGDSEYEEAYSDYEEEDEDEYDETGRYKYRVVDETIHARMQELQAKLGFKSTKELMEEESRIELEDPEPDNGKLLDGGIGRITVNPMEPVKSSLKTDDKTSEIKSVNKGVKFADELDIAGPPAEPTESAEPQTTFVDPMRTTIVERAPTASPATPASTTPKKASRFKKAKTASSATPDALPIRQPHNAPTRFLDADTDVRTAPAGPEGRTLAEAVVERDLPSEVKEPDEFDAALLHQEAAVEYNRMRNRMIQKEGGFVKEREAPIEYPEDVDEGGKRLSRFKAARLARQ